MPQSRSTAPPPRGTERKRIEEQIKTEQTPHMKSTTHQERRTVLERPEGKNTGDLNLPISCAVFFFFIIITVSYNAR